MAHRSQSSSIGDNPLDPNYLPPHYREEYRIAIDALIENDIQGYYEFLQLEDVVSFLAQPEIEYIKSTIQAPNLSSSVPELTYLEGGIDAEGSSDTYWPMQSDLAAPGLDLGWPMAQHNFIGPTEVTTLVNPSDPDMPSIKEQARRLIKNARQFSAADDWNHRQQTLKFSSFIQSPPLKFNTIVIAVVMDMFTDVDIFADLLDAAARHVPVYILLDEHEVHHFVSMVINCKVNLDLIPMMRVRTVAGITYYSRTGKSFKGQVKDRFLLADCRAVLSGNYSFMWSYEKLHRCIAHLFLGELVTTFDEEFRILFAQSEPLVIDPSNAALVSSDTSNTSSYLSSQFGLKRSQSLRNPIGYRRPEITSGFPYGDSALPFRRNDPFRHTVEPGAGITIGKYSQQQFRLQQSFLEQGRSIVSRQMEMSGFKRHSYAEGTQESYASSRQYMKHRVMNNLDETDFQREQIHSSHFYSEGPGPGSGHGHYDRLRGRPPQLSIDQYSESSFRSDVEPPLGNYGRDYFSSEDLRVSEGHQGPPVAGRYEGGASNKRPTIGQAYACQNSPTQPHPPEKKPFHTQADQEQNVDPSVKQGLRNWRIHSYLSTYEDSGEEGLTQPLGPDAFDEPQPSQQQTTTENPAPRFGIKEPPKVPSKPRPDILRPRFGKPKLPESSNKDSVLPTAKDLLPSLSDLRPSILEKKERELEKEKEKERETERGATREMGVDKEVKETPDLLLSKHESFRSRVNPLLQRSSRLRSSLIFSSSKAEIHSGSLGLKPAAEEEEELDTIRTSSIVAQILEKRRSMTREPFDWRKKALERDKEKEEKQKEEKENKEKQKEQQREEREIQLKQGNKEKEEPQKTKEEVKTTPTPENSEVTASSSLNMNDPANRLQYFKELAAKRKASRMETEPLVKGPEPAEKKLDLSEKPPLNTTTTPRIPSVSVSSAELAPRKPDLSGKPSLNIMTQKIPTVSVSSEEPAPKKPDPTDKPPLNTMTQKIPTVSVSSEEPAPKKPDPTEKPPLNTTTAPKIPTVSLSSAEPPTKKPDISTKLVELTRRPSFNSAKPSIITAKPFMSSLKLPETSPPQKEENTSEGQKKDIFKSLKPLPSPKIFKRDPLKLKGLNPRRISCGEEILTTDATDAEKSELRKNRSHSSSTLPHDDAKEGLRKMMGSNTSINTIGEGKGEKTLDFLKKQTQRLKGFLGPKDKEKKASGEDRGMSTVKEVTDDSSRHQSSSAKDTTSTTPDQTNHKTSLGTSISSRYQAPGSSVLFSSNLRDDTKVILEQISANSQKNRQEREETGGDKESHAGDKGLDTSNSGKKNRFLRPSGNLQEREGLLKRIESLRKEKKVYSRFEMGNSLG